MRPRQDLVVADVAGLVLLLIVVVVGWYEAAAFGLAVLVVLNATVLLRERLARSSTDGGEEQDG